MVPYFFPLIFKKNNPQKSLGPYQQDTRKPNPTFKPDHLQMCFRPRFNSRRRFLGGASFWKSACQFLEALSCVSSVFSRFLSTHKVNVHREWTWTERLHQNLAVLWLPRPVTLRRVQGKRRFQFQVGLVGGEGALPFQVGSWKGMGMGEIWRGSEGFTKVMSYPL